MSPLLGGTRNCAPPPGETSGSPVVDPAGKLLGYRGADMRGSGGLFQNLETFGLAAD